MCKRNNNNNVKIVGKRFDNKLAQRRLWHMSTQNISLEIDIKMVTRDCDKGDDTLA